MKGIWNNNEVKELFSVVEDCKEKNESLKLAFKRHAEKYGRKPNSVRNYYYHEVDNLKVDNGRLEKLGIDLNLHNKSSFVYFSEEEERKLMEEVDSRVKQGISVRKACLDLSGGDVNQMLRFQNKYRNFIARVKKSAKNTEKIDKITPNNVITFKKQPKSLSDGEVQALFMGLVRLVKKNALEESEAQYQNKLTQANEMLRKAILRLSNKQRDEDKLKEEIERLKTENSKLMDLNLKLKCDKADFLREKLEKDK